MGISSDRIANRGKPPKTSPKPPADSGATMMPRHKCPISDKRSYSTKTEAERILLQMLYAYYIKDTTRLNVYQCQCGNWHVGRSANVLSLKERSTTPEAKTPKTKTRAQIVASMLQELNKRFAERHAVGLTITQKMIDRRKLLRKEYTELTKNGVVKSPPE
jgi:hypothetical protein